MNDRLAHCRGWLRKAESDLADASRTIASDGPYDTACFHCQQAVEKGLKGLLAFLDQSIPHTHDLEELQRLCLNVAPDLPLADFDLVTLSGYAVEMRYDFDFWPDRQTAQEAIDLAHAAREVAAGSLPYTNGVASYPNSPVSGQESSTTPARLREPLACLQLIGPGPLLIAPGVGLDFG
ncbi:MAG: HEPN domain-containing protein [Candidatus Eisenbacteria sp.]|nr:HEPN domain-containing protein [Candidatus Eisenbacteria bacterium]